MISTDFMSEAVCTSVDPELFFPDMTGAGARNQARRAAAICEGCPVVVQCRTYAEQIGATHGVWGAQHRHGKPVVDVVITHGTEAGYKAHYRRGQSPCEACRAASNRANKERAARRRSA